MRRTMLMISVASVLAACGPTSHLAQVTRFHEGKLGAGRTFVVVPEPSQEGSLEFASYARLIADQLVVQGFRPAAPGAKSADLAVMFRYGVDDGRAEVWSVPPYSQEWYWQRRYQTAAPIPAPAGTYVPAIADIHTTTVFTRWLEVDILEAERLRAGARDKLFEARAVSEGANRDLTEVLPYVIQAVFAEFPGPSGVTVPVRVLEAPGPERPLPPPNGSTPIAPAVEAPKK